MKQRFSLIVLALTLVVATGCGSNNSGGPVTPEKLAQKIVDSNHKANTNNPLTNVQCYPQSDVKADGSGTYFCDEYFQSGGQSRAKVAVNPDGSWKNT
ncbi:hypothetical protein ACFVVC_01640 [Pseudarthrobacter sp. NPDC058196]|uniref:hypothetical protein n=1 Tax=Pseudarthrobacter sp. NPDC058196 TaxID=3346376 RepID=UPI0036DA6125